MKKSITILCLSVIVCLSGDFEDGEFAYKNKNYQDSIKYFQMACDSGSAAGCTYLGLIYDNGRGVSQDYGKAKEFYQKSCDGGGASGCMNLGVMYKNGQGVSQDYGKAKEFYQKSCDGGGASGCTNLGVLYHNGQGVSQDYGKAKEFYQKGCDGGSTAGCTNLGVIYHNGQGVSQDYDKAKEFYQKSCDAGDADGCKKFATLKNQSKNSSSTSKSNDISNTGIISKNGIAKDSATGLMWQDNSDVKTIDKNWFAAMQYCEDLKLGGFSDWRLSNIYELSTLVNPDNHETYIVDGIQNIKSEYYWSATADPYDRDGARVVAFGSNEKIFNYGRSNENRVRCVRGSQLSFDDFSILVNKGKIKLEQKDVDKLSKLKNAIANKKLNKQTYNSEIKWEKNFTVAMDRALKENKPLMVLVADLCFFCERFERNALKDPEVVMILNRDFVTYKGNSSTDTQIPSSLSTGGTPTTWFLKGKSPLFEPVMGVVERDKFLQALNIVKNEFKK